MGMAPVPVCLKIAMWGLPELHRLEHGGQLLFSVRTTAELFGKYMRDMKVARVSMCDARNGEELGTGVVNWVVFMRKIPGRDSPFLEDSFDFFLPIHNHRAKQIA